MLRTATRRAMLYPEAAAAAAGGGWWDDSGSISGCVGAYQAKDAASYAASLTDISGNEKDLTEGAAPSWNATDGWIGTGTEWLETGILPASGYSALVRVTSITSGVIFGSSGGVWNRFAISRISDPWMQFDNGNGALRNTGYVDGVYGVAGNRPYLNGSDLTGSDIGAWTTAATVTVKLFRNASGSYGTVKIQAAAFYSETLSATDMATISTAMAAL